MLKMTATEFALDQIKNNKNKIKFEKEIRLQISNFRLTGKKYPRTAVGEFANKEANKLEKQLLEAQKGITLK